MPGIYEGVEGFIRWCQGILNEDKLDKYPLLQDYIYDWVWGGATEPYYGEFDTYMRDVMLIYVAYAKYPAMLDLPPRRGRPQILRRPSSRIDPDRMSVRCFDRSWWDQL